MVKENVRIVHADNSHASLLSKLASETFSTTFAQYNDPEDFKKYLEDSFNLQQVEKELNEIGSTFLVAYHNNEVAGYARLRESPEVAEKFPQQRTLELQRIYSLDKFIGQGIGKSLLMHCVSYAREKQYDLLWLGVWGRNKHAIEFYTHFGFEFFGSHVFMLGKDAQTDILMKLKIK